MASFFCQQLIKNTLSLCQSYITRLLSEKSSRLDRPKSELIDDHERIDTKGSLERILLGDGIEEKSKDEEGANIGKRASYYVEENEKLLNLLITNCEPILSEIVHLIDHFNSYNGIQKVIDKSQLFS